MYIYMNINTVCFIYSKKHFTISSQLDNERNSIIPKWLAATRTRRIRIQRRAHAQLKFLSNLNAPSKGSTYAILCEEVAFDFSFINTYY